MQARPDIGGALVHDAQPQVLGGRLARVEAAAIVCDGQLDACGLAAEAPADLAGLGVLEDVVQGFLGNAVQADLSLIREKERGE